MAERRARKQVLVVDARQVFAEALAVALNRDRRLRAHPATTTEAAVELAASLRPDVVLTSLEVVDDDASAIRRVREAHPSAFVIAIVASHDDVAKARMLEAGARSFLPASSSLQEVRDWVLRAARGRLAVDVEEAARLLRSLRHRRLQHSTEQQRVERLTPRQLEILQMMADGMTPPEIAERLGMSPLTLRTHVQNILTRLGVHTKLEAVALAIKHGKVSLRA